jgi:hypothetical protein
MYFVHLLDVYSRNHISRLHKTRSDEMGWILSGDYDYCSSFHEILIVLSADVYDETVLKLNGRMQSQNVSPFLML